VRAETIITPKDSLVLNPWQYARPRLATLFRTLRYHYRLTLWLYLNRWRRLRAFFRRHLDLVRRTTFIVTAAALGVLVNRFGGSSFTPGVLSTYLITVGTMTGATIAIVFTISIFLLQGTADIYSSEYLDVYVHDWKEKLVYFAVILITIGLFGAGLFAGSLSSISPIVASFLVVGSLVSIATAFALIDWQYKLVRQKVTPTATIAFLEKESVRFLRKLETDAGRLAGIMLGKDGSLNRNTALAAAYNRFLQPFISNLDRQVENLVQLSIKLADRHEVATTKRSLLGVYRILGHYLDARKTSSLVLPSAVAFLAVESDSQAFLTRNCERLNTAGEKFVRENRDELATHLVDVYGALAARAGDMVFLSGRNENPVLDLFTAFLNLLIDYASRAQNTEVVYQGSRVLGDIAAMAAASGLSTTLHGLQGRLLANAVFGLTHKHIVIIDRCTMTFLRIVDVLFESEKIVRQHHVAMALENIATIAMYHASFLSSGLARSDFSTSLSLTKPYDEFPGLLRRTIQRYEGLTDEVQKARYRHDLIELFQELNRTLRKLSEDLKSCDTILTDSVSRLLFETNGLIVELMGQTEFSSEKTELRKSLTWNTHLPSWFAHHAPLFDGSSGPFRTLVDSVAMTGILVAERLGDPALVNECVNCLGSLVDHCLEKTRNRYGFDEPRVLEKACYLGIIAHKKGWKDVVTNVGLKIYAYEPKYYAKYFTQIPAGIDPANHNVMGLPHSDQLQRELWKWRDDFERERWRATPFTRDDAERMMNEVIEAIDIDRFMFEVWAVWLEGTPFDDEIRLRLARKRLLQALKSVLERKRNESS